MGTTRWQKLRRPVDLTVLGQWATLIASPVLPRAEPSISGEGLVPLRTAPILQQANRNSALHDLLQDAPLEFRCALDGQLMLDPIQTPYGHVCARQALVEALANNGGYCPLSGAPL